MKLNYFFGLFIFIFFQLPALKATASQELGCPGMDIVFRNFTNGSFRFDTKNKYNENVFCGKIVSPKYPEAPEEIEITYRRYPALNSPEKATTLIFVNGGPGDDNYLERAYYFKKSNPF